MLLKKSSLSIIIIATVGTVLLLLFIPNRFGPPVTPPPINGGDVVGVAPAFNPPPPNSQFSIPSSILLQVPFTPQAPTANWDELHGESCEETSAIMVAQYFLGNRNATLDPELVEGQITKLTEWEKQTFGYYLDINSEETARMIRENYGLHAEIETDYTEQTIKQALVHGKLVLFPAQGQQLGNPNYRRPGPPYHMIVIKGYTKDGFVTNDPGTRRGASYPYTFDVLYNANGDWNHDKHAFDTNKKMIIIVSNKPL